MNVLPIFANFCFLVELGAPKTPKIMGSWSAGERFVRSPSATLGRIIQHASAQVKIDGTLVPGTPHEKRVHIRFGPFLVSFDKRSQYTPSFAPQTGAIRA